LKLFRYFLFFITIAVVQHVVSKEYTNDAPQQDGPKRFDKEHTCPTIKETQAINSEENNKERLVMKAHLNHTKSYH
jgi:hypothetical protein